MAVYTVDESLTTVLLTAVHTCFMSHLLVLVSVLVLLQLVLTTRLWIGLIILDKVKNEDDDDDDVSDGELH